MMIVSSIKDNFCLSLTKSLSKVKYPIALAVTRRGIPWGKCAEFLHKMYLKNLLRTKDCFGYSLASMSPIAESDIVSELTKKWKPKFGTLDKYLSKNIKEYQKEPTAENSYRTIRRLKSYEGSQALIVEFDNVVLPKAQPEAVVGFFDSIGVSYAAYSTWSSTPENRKYRVVVPFTGLLDRNQYATCCEVVVFLLDQSYGIVKDRNLDLSCLRPIQFFYPPNNSTNKVDDDNAIHQDRPWFRSKDNGLGLDLDKIYGICRYLHKNKIHLNSLTELNRLAKKEVEDDNN